jgi:hypothetical protein
LLSLQQDVPDLDEQASSTTQTQAVVVLGVAPGSKAGQLEMAESSKYTQNISRSLLLYFHTLISRRAAVQ